MSDIGENLINIRSSMNKASEAVGGIERPPLLIAVSKTIGVGRILEALDAGVTDIGENRVQEAQDKFPIIGRRARWHLIGHLQTNKARKAVELFDVIHTVDSTELGDRISSSARDLGRNPEILVQVNVDGDNAKAGVGMGETRELLGYLGSLPNIRVVGLMTIGRLTDDPEEARLTFRKLMSLARELKASDIPGVELRELSMGMSGDYVQAIEEGSTMVRVGSAIFGSRHYPQV